MYLDYWSLERNPFEAVPDSRYYFATPKHEAALAAMNYAARECGEPIVVGGPVGCGKTLLLRTLRRQLPQSDYQVVFVPELAGGDVGLLRRIAHHWTRTIPRNTAEAIDTISHAAQECEQAGRGIVIMLDDWPQSPATQTLDELHWLLNLDIENAHAAVLMTCAAASPHAQWPDWLTQRLFTVADVVPIDSTLIAPYLSHRLQAAGHDSGEVFTPDASDMIAAWSGGVPRLINRAAHLSLQVASLNLAKRIDGGLVTQAVERLVRCEARHTSNATGTSATP